MEGEATWGRCANRKRRRARGNNRNGCRHAYTVLKPHSRASSALTFTARLVRRRLG